MSNLWWREERRPRHPGAHDRRSARRHPGRGRRDRPPGRLPPPRGIVHGCRRCSTRTRRSRARRCARSCRWSPSTAASSAAARLPAGSRRCSSRYATSTLRAMAKKSDEQRAARREGQARRDGARETACSCTARPPGRARFAPTTAGVKVVAERKRLIGSRVTQPLLRGPARLAEAFAVLPRVKRALPEARLPFEGAHRGRLDGRGGGRAARASAAAGSRDQPGAGRRPARDRSRAARAPRRLARRLPRRRAHRDRQLRARRARPRRSTSAAAATWSGRCSRRPPLGNLLAARAPTDVRPAARLAASLGAVAASTEIFGWMQRNPDRRLARALARPGHELQHRLSTAEPSPDAARGRRGGARRLPRARSASEPLPL